ncbi:MAG: hypothetical protein ACI8W8_003048, partial [Rhodothermales bacterium]
MTFRLMRVLVFVAEFAMAQSAPVFSWQFDRDTEISQHRIVANDITQSGLPLAALTVSAWVRIDAPAEWGGIVSALQDNGAYERGWFLGYHKDRFCIALASATSKKLTYLNADRPFDAGLWHYLVGSYDGRELRIFVDGKPAGSSSAQSGDILYPPKGVVALGAYVDDNETYRMQGALAEIAIWDRAMPGDEVASAFDARKAEFPDFQDEPKEITGWPTHRRDIARSGHSPTPLT